MSSHTEQYQAFAHYNQAFNRQLYAVVGELSDGERKADRGAFFKSIHQTLNHILLADRIWLGRFKAAGIGAAAIAGDAVLEKFSGLGQELYSDFAELTKERAKTDATIVSWTGSLQANEVAGQMTYKNSKGEAHSHAVWIAISHLFNHQTHHRGQITTLLSQVGKDPGVTDLAAFLRKWPAV